MRRSRSNVMFDFMFKNPQIHNGLQRFYIDSNFNAVDFYSKDGKCVYASYIPKSWYYNDREVVMIIDEMETEK